ncbi:MAG: hypothetical protein DMG07_28425 [Acidobacteria bacterium]|nr:MAG: hypothetical protein DMG07_28425 [Acidobacteriota bacterium]
MKLRLLFGMLCMTQAIVAQQPETKGKSYFDVVREAYPIPPRVKRLVRKDLVFPKVGEYQVVTGDFHLHTIFSGGSVLPSERIYEAYSDGLDVLAITDHAEYMKTAMPDDTGRAYTQVKDLAASLGLVLIRGAEVSTVYSAENELMSEVTARKNADFIVLFVKDENSLFAPFETAMERARQQGCLNILAHPGPDWHPMAKKFLQMGWLHGVEIRNTGAAGGTATDEVDNRFLYPKVANWAREKGLAMIASSDAHAATRFERDPNQDRDFTLLLVKERSPEGVRDAIVSKRTMAWFENMLWGSEENLSALAAGSLELQEIRMGGVLRGIRIYNKSAFPFEVRFLEGQGAWRMTRSRITLPAHSTTACPASFSAGSAPEIRLRLTNVFVDKDTNLELKKRVATGQ